MNNLGIQEMTFLFLLLALTFILLNGFVYFFKRSAFENTFRKSLKVFSILLLLVLVIPLVRIYLF